MNSKYTKVLIAAAFIAAASSCAKHDLIPEITEVGQAVPTVYWEVGSTVCKAGESFTFQGKYTNEPYRTPLRSEVWYQVIRNDAAAVSTALAGTSLSYTQTVTSSDTIRSFQCYASFDHSRAVFNGHEYIIQGEVPTSRTLGPVSWLDATEWDQERFDTYYPEGFVKNYLEKVYDYLTGASANSYYGALRNVFINYHFTAEQLKANGFGDIDVSGDDNGANEKSKAWFTTTEASAAAQKGFYYITIDASGENEYHEVATEEEAPAGVTLFPTYKAAEWVFCRYDDNSGAIVSTVYPEWLPKFRELISVIPFKDWIYDSANSIYKVDFSRAYSLQANFRAYDKDTDKLNDPNAPEHEGITALTEQKTITLN